MISIESFLKFCEDIIMPYMVYFCYISFAIYYSSKVLIFFSTFSHLKIFFLPSQSVEEPL